MFDKTQLVTKKHQMMTKQHRKHC